MTVFRTSRSASTIGALLGMALIVAACGGGEPSASPAGATGAASGSPSGVTPTGTTAAVGEPPPASPAPASAPASTYAPPAAPGTLTPGAFAEVTVDALRVRSAASVDSPESGAMLNAGQLVYLIEGPTSASGYDWFHIQADLGFGWVAAGAEGVPYLAPTAPSCPATAPTEVSQVEALAPAERLACFGGNELTLRGWATPSPQSGGDFYYVADPEWLAHPFRAQLLESQTAEFPRGYPYGVPYRVNPASGLTAAPTGQWVQLSGHFDDPLSTSCTWTPAAGAGVGPVDALDVVTQCREQFVMTSFTPAAAP